MALVDGGLQFGDVGVLLNLNPKNPSIADVAREMAGGDLETLDATLVDHSSGIRVLMAPPSPEMAELITPDHVSRIVSALRATHDLVVVDCSPLLQDVTLAFLDRVGRRADGADARDHQHQEHPPVPGPGRAARLSRARSSWC